MRKRIALFLLLGMLWQVLAIPAAAEWDPVEEQKKQLIREMVYSFGMSRTYSERVDYLMGELKKNDRSAAKRWKEVLDYWDYANNHMRIKKRLHQNLPDDDTLCIVVMGYQLGYNGAIQEELLGRLQVALEASKQYPNAYILCTGGSLYGAGGVTEAGQMEWWLTENGVDPERIIAETRSTCTAENAIYSMQILREEYPDVAKLAIVSSDYHITWGAVLFQTAAILAAKNPKSPEVEVVSNASYKTVYSSSVSPWDTQIWGIQAVAGLV